MTPIPPRASQDSRDVTSFCRICNAMCGIVVTVATDEDGHDTVTRVRGDDAHPLFEVRDGKHSGSYFYGPRYYGSSWPSGRPKPSANAIEATRAGPGGATQLARAGSGSGSGSTYAHTSSSSVSRSGFGSSAHASSGGG